MDIRRILFLTLGLTRAYPSMDRKLAKRASEKLVEPQGSRVSRRNIIVLSGVLVLAGFAGADLHSLSLFGVEPTENWGVNVLGIAAVLAQLYWYFLRYQHLSEDGTIERDQDPGFSAERAEPLKISRNTALGLVRKEADLFSNWVAFLLTCLSWYFIYLWIVDGSPP